MRLIRKMFGARAAGWWRVTGDRLELLGFCAAADMPEEVARGYVRETRSVPRTDAALDVVRAALGGAVVFQSASERASCCGSCRWLGRFGASRSVAVPVPDRSRVITRVVYVALADGPGEPIPAEEVARRVLDCSTPWAGPRFDRG
jgi:hypothetical protein